MTFKSLNKLFFDRAEQYNEKPFLWAKKDKEWIKLQITKFEKTLKNVKSNSVFWSACLSQFLIFVIFFSTDISFLWLNVIGAFLTVIFSAFTEKVNS